MRAPKRSGGAAVKRPGISVILATATESRTIVRGTSRGQNYSTERRHGQLVGLL